MHGEKRCNKRSGLYRLYKPAHILNYRLKYTSLVEGGQAILTGSRLALTILRGAISFLADLPADALGAEFTVGFGIGAVAAFFTIGLVIFLANGKCGAIGVTNAIHLIQLLFFDLFIICPGI